MTSRRDRIAAVLMKLRGCNEPGGSAESGMVPCPFCFWGLEAEEEAGCYAWADAIIAAEDATDEQDR